MPTPDYERICFVVMPFGRKKVGRKPARWYRPWTRPRWVDFDWVYENIFKPAISETPLPEGGMLEPKRADREFVTGHIGIEMFHYLEYSRFTVADITGLNFNVAYELGHRHRSRQSGTAILRQIDAAIPFDIAQVRAFPYEYQPEARARESREFLTRVLTESLTQNRLDSPIQIALRLQREQRPSIDDTLHRAEEALRHRDWATAVSCYRTATRLDPDNPLARQRLGLLLKEHGQFIEALAEFDAAIELSSAYADAYREKGIVENKLFEKARAAGRDTANMASGEDALRTAITLQPDDYDALAALGGVLKRFERWEEAAVTYRRATEASFGHPYPLLNELILRARARGEMAVDEHTVLQLKRAERSRLAQTLQNPPYDSPWSHFDLATIRLFLGDDTGFLENLELGLSYCTAAWQARTFYGTLALLPAGGVSSPAVEQGLRLVKTALEALPDPT